MIVDVASLARLGFNDKKARLYLTILAGGGTAAELASRAKLKRSTVYDYLEELIQDRLVSQSIRKSRRFFVSESPDNLTNLFQRRLDSVKAMLPGLQSLFASGSGTIPHVRYYEGIDGVRKIHDELLSKPGGEYFYFGSMRSFVDILGQEYLSNFTSQRLRRKIRSNGIRMKNQETNEPDSLGTEENLRRVHYLPVDMVNCPASITIFNGKISVISAEKKIYGFIIEEQNLYMLLKTIWDFVWENTHE